MEVTPRNAGQRSAHRTQSERVYVRLDDDPLYAPETTAPPGTMRAFTVPFDLRELVAHVFSHEESFSDGMEVVERVVPDGALRLIFDLGDGAVAARVVGPDARPLTLRLRGHTHALSTGLRPGAALALFNLPAHELTGQAVAWHALASPRHRDLPGRLREAEGDPARAGLLLKALQESMRPSNAGEWRSAQHAMALFRGAPGARPVGAVAEAIGVGERRLQQLFRAHLGLSPRTWRRLARLHECLRLLRQPSPLPWHALAVDGGFYDQSHLTNEFRSLCGLTPEQFLRRCVSGSSKTAA